MSVTKRTVVAVGAAGALVTIGGIVFAYERADEEAPFQAIGFVEDSATVECEGSIVELDFDPEGRIDARARGETVASADAARRGLNYDACSGAPTQRGWFVGIRYTTVKERTMVTCRFPRRFSVHVHPVSPSWAGDRPAGSAVYLVLGERAKRGPGPNRTILASASVLERSEESSVSFAPQYCAAS
jgi:hypothetical protein